MNLAHAPAAEQLAPHSRLEHFPVALFSTVMGPMTIASFVMGERSGLPFFTWLAEGLLVVLSALVGVLVVKTLGAALQGRICVPE